MGERTVLDEHGKETVMQQSDDRSRRRGRLVMVGVMAFMLVAAAAVAQVAAGPFDDVPDDHLFAKEIAWMKDTRVTRGCNPPDNTEYCPEDAISRGEMAAFFYRYHDTMGGVLTDAQIEQILELVLGEIGEGGDGLTAAQVQALIDESLTDYLTESEIRDLIVEVLGEEGLTSDDVELLIETALLDLELGLGEAEVQALITTALGGLDLGLDAAAVQALIDAALGGLDLGLGSDAVQDLIDAALLSIELGLDADGVQALIDSALLDLDLGLDAAAVQGLIDTALGAVTGGILDDVNDLVGGLLGGVEESLESALTDELTLRQTSVPILLGVNATAEVDCEADEVPIAGGFSSGGLLGVNVIENRPTATGWRVVATATVLGDLTAYVTCAAVGA